MHAALTATSSTLDCALKGTKAQEGRVLCRGPILLLQAAEHSSPGRFSELGLLCPSDGVTLPGIDISILESVMRETARVLMLIAAAASAVCAAQISSTTVATNHGARLAETPYTAEYGITTVQTLANGTTITRESTEKIAVDAQGRRMNSSTIEQPAGRQNPIMWFHVSDPVAHTNLNWTSQGKRVTMTTMPEPGQRPACETSGDSVARHSDIHHEKPVIEELGTTTIQGIEAKGTRTTRTIPAGAEGNDAPLVTTNEYWRATASNLRHLSVREVWDDPRNGKRTKELTNFVQGDPDPSLFEPPPGYEIVKEGPPEVICSSEQ
jgi:hypothetical protein